MNRRDGHAETVIKCRRYIELCANEAVGKIKVRRRLLLGDRRRVQPLPLRLAVGKLRAGDLRREANDLPSVLP